MNIRKPEAKSAINQFRSFLATSGVDVPLNLMQEGFARSQGFDDWQALCAYEAVHRRSCPMVQAEVVPDAAPGSRLRFAGKDDDAVWVRFPSGAEKQADISVRLARSKDGVHIRMYPAAREDRDCLERAYLSYSDATRVDNLHSFDAQGFKPMIWGELRWTEALRFNEGVLQLVTFVDDDVLLAVDCWEHREPAAMDALQNSFIYHDDSQAIAYTSLDNELEMYLCARDLRGARIDATEVIHLKDGRQLRFVKGSDRT